MGPFPVYRGYSSQYGSGLGNVLGGIIRASVPFLKPIIKQLGTQFAAQGSQKHFQKRGLPFIGNIARKAGHAAFNYGLNKPERLMDRRARTAPKRSHKRRNANKKVSVGEKRRKKVKRTRRDALS